MSVKIMGLVWDTPLPPAQKIVLLAMADHADHAGENVRPGIELVSRKTGYSTRQVKRIQGQLRDAGLLVLEQERPGGNMPNIYRIDPRALLNLSKGGGDKLAPGGEAKTQGGGEAIATSYKPSVEPTDLKEPSLGSHDTPATESKSPRSRTTREPACDCPEGFQANEAQVQKMIEHGLDAEDEVERFRLHHEKKGNRWAGTRGWTAALWQWINNAVKWGAERKSGGWPRAQASLFAASTAADLERVFGGGT